MATSMCYGGASRMEAPYADILDRIYRYTHWQAADQAQLNCGQLAYGAAPARRRLPAFNEPTALHRTGEESGEHAGAGHPLCTSGFSI